MTTLTIVLDCDENGIIGVYSGGFTAIDSILEYICATYEINSEGITIRRLGKIIFEFTFEDRHDHPHTWKFCFEDCEINKTTKYYSAA